MHIAKNQHHRPAKTVHNIMCHHTMPSKSQAKAVVKRMVDEIENAAIKERQMYHNLANTARLNGVQCTVWPVQVGSRGMVDTDSFMNLLLFLGLSGSATAGLFCGLSGTALRETFSIWCSCNCPVILELVHRTYALSWYG